MSGVFLVFEGIEGAGKSLQISLLAQRLRKRGVDPLLTKEPGGTKVGMDIRNLLLGESGLVSMAELFLCLADRAQHVEEVILPALREGKIVLCDRFSFSTIAYQGYGRGIDISFLKEADAWGTGGLNPHLVVLLDLPVEAALQRIQGRRLDRMEREERAFHERVREGFLVQAREEPSLFLVVDGAKSPVEVSEEVLRGIQSRVPQIAHLL